jgi:hypothetical protein
MINFNFMKIKATINAPKVVAELRDTMSFIDDNTSCESPLNAD